MIPVRRILLVEDDLATAEFARIMLARTPGAENVHLEVANTMREALDRLDRAEFDRVWCDLNLPDSEGTATLARLVQSTRAPVAVLTGHDPAYVRDEALAVGAESVWSKDCLRPTIPPALLCPDDDAVPSRMAVGR